MGTKPKTLRKRITGAEVEKINIHYKNSIEQLYKRKMDESKRREKIVELKYEIIGLICPPLLTKLILSKISFEGNEIDMKRLVSSTIEVRIY